MENSIELYSSVLQDLNICCIHIANFEKLSFVCNESANLLGPHVCAQLVEAAMEKNMPFEFTFRESVVVRSRKLGSQGVVFWQTPTTPPPLTGDTANKPDQVYQYTKAIQPLFTQIPAMMTICRVVKMEDGQEEVEVLAATDFHAKIRGKTCGQDLVGLLSGRDLKRDVAQDIKAFRKCHEEPGKVFKFRVDTPVGSFDHIYTPFYVPGCDDEAYFVAAFDVTELTRELRNSELRLRSIVDHIPVGAFELDGKTTETIWTNTWFREAIGLNQTEWMGLAWRDSLAVGEWLKTWDEHLKGTSPFCLEAQLKMADGLAHDFLCRVQPIHDSQGQVERWVGTSTDITEKKQLERTLLAANEQLQKVSQIKSAFISHVSHEIRTPLNAIVNMLEFLWSTRLDIEQRDYVSTCIQSSNLLLSLLNDCLDLSKIEAGKLTVTPTNFQVMPLALGCVDMFCDMAGTRGLEMWCRVSPDVPEWVHGDPLRIRQILCNLISNACKYTNTGSVLVHVTLGIEQNSVTFSVCDSGPGLTAEQKQNLFQPFSQVLGAKQAGIAGTGLGLAISSQLCKCMGGSISVDDNAPCGSIFSFSLPLLSFPDGTPNPNVPILPNFATCLPSSSSPLLMPHRASFSSSRRPSIQTNVLIMHTCHVALESISSLLHGFSEIECTITTCCSTETCTSDCEGQKWDLVICSIEPPHSTLKPIETRSCILLQPNDNSSGRHDALVTRSSSSRSSGGSCSSDSNTADLRLTQLSAGSMTFSTSHSADPADLEPPVSPAFINTEVMHSLATPLHPIHFRSLVKSVLTGARSSFSLGAPFVFGTNTCAQSSSSPAPQPVVQFEGITGGDCAAHHHSNPSFEFSTARRSSVQLTLAPVRRKSRAENFLKPKVLVAEDNAINQKVIKKMCIDGGLDPHVVSDGQQCVNAWLEHPAEYSAILMDVNMPVMDGIVATTEIRRIEAERGQSATPIPIIALTASAMTDSETSCKAAGMTTFLSKPVRLPVLLETLAPFLSR